MLEDAPPNIIKLAVARAIIDTFDQGKWHEIGLITNTLDDIEGHPRLLRSMRFGDDDYSACVYQMIPIILDEQTGSKGIASRREVAFGNLETVTTFIGLKAWLQKNDIDLYESLYGETGWRRQVGTQSTELDEVDPVTTVPKISSASPIRDAQKTQGPTTATVPSRRRVFLVHGRDLAKRDSLTALLRAFDLRTITWSEAEAATGVATPYTGDVVIAGMDAADIVVVLLTPDDLGQLSPEFIQVNDGPEERQPSGQPRMNVIFEAGMAMARSRNSVIFVEIGKIRPMSDITGLNVLRLTNDVESRRQLGTRLRTAGLTVDMEHDGWRSAGDFT
ncbi:TIR domain-containing protein [Cryptosporangium aurantiacum]|uniref:Predicted nucleotide-binding protein containing TIR-like domain n=1 Tax=Cryptosporangium aurantiacum TaxID=134849 RepID=A0A1M7QQY0_9ACTN|nr:TIR domain-containing protein [Cryptosporangium aurantiacum]SHN33974.1 Predicted nucleotide-binding protein containing TIR-like domain [Cryptosporangium aurantiacum]